MGWHDAYDEPGSSLHRRLRIVRELLVDALDQMPRRPLRLVSMCAGQGRDVIGALAEHPRRHDVAALLVELDEGNAEAARAGARAAGLPGVQVVSADAGLTDAYRGGVPADIVVVCGVFGNIVDDDIAFTIEQLPQICADGAIVIWTRNREPADLTTTIRKWFAAAGFGEVALVAPSDVSFAVGVHRLLGTPTRLSRGVRFFDFLDEQLPVR